MRYNIVDNNALNPSGVIDFVADNVKDYSISQCYNQLAPEVDSPNALETRLLTIVPPSINASDVNNLFDEYDF